MTGRIGAVSEICPFNIGRIVNAHIVLDNDLCEVSAGIGFEYCDAGICPYTFGDWGAWRTHGGALARHYAEMLGLGFPEHLVCLMVGYDAQYVLDAVGWPS